MGAHHQLTVACNMQHILDPATTALCSCILRSCYLQKVGCYTSCAPFTTIARLLSFVFVRLQEPSVCEELCYSHDVILQVQSLLTASVPANFEVNSMAMSSDQIHLEVSQDGLELNKARTHAAWLLARLASNHQHRCVWDGGYVA